MSEPKSKKYSDRLALLMHYSCVFLGLIIGLLAACATLLAAKGLSIEKFSLKIIMMALVCLLISGMATGIIANSIPEYQTYEDFEKADLGFIWWKPYKFKIWSIIQHYSFWAGVFTALLGMVIPQIEYYFK